MTVRIGVDVGGTFTDLIAVDQLTGELSVGKSRSTPASPDLGVLEVIDAVLDDDAIRRAEYFLHGTTTGLNALLERKGGAVGLLATRGFRDVLELRRGHRPNMFDLLWTPAPPLVPRRRRLPVTERVLSDGVVDRVLVEDDVRAAAEVFEAEGVESVAIAFLNSHANPAHELRARDLLRAAGFQGAISISSEVTGEYGEYERTCTTVVDAYVRPVMSGYLRRLEDGLRTRGFAGEPLITRSGGGAMTFREAGDRPFETVMSGPVAGVAGSAQLCSELGIDRAITADVGGTSFDTSLVIDGRPQVRYEGEVVGMPLQTPWVDVRSIGAGGGSIAHANAGLLRVGPQSAGANPGPVCYGSGGSEPTVTDAAVVLGMLAYGELAGGLSLDVDAARGAVGELGAELGLDLDEAARGVLIVASAAMAGAIRQITIERGEDPREAALIAYGGAGPLFGTLVARELDIRTVVVPRAGGNFSAWGLLCADIVQSAARTSLAALDAGGIDMTQEILGELLEVVRSRSTIATNGGKSRHSEAALDLRYSGQDHALTVAIAVEDERIAVDAAGVRESFTSEYERTFGHGHDEPVEIVSVRATVRTPLGAIGSAALPPSGAEREPGHPPVDAYSFTLGRRVPFDVLERSALGPGDRVAGPSVIVEQTTTTYVDAGFSLEAHPSGALILIDEGTAA